MVITAGWESTSPGAGADGTCPAKQHTRPRAAAPEGGLNSAPAPFRPVRPLVPIPEKGDTDAMALIQRKTADEKAAEQATKELTARDAATKKAKQAFFGTPAGKAARPTRVLNRSGIGAEKA
jgi:hypothetical protein